MSQVPSLSQFDPKIIPFQYQVIHDLRKKFSFDKGMHEILLSGAIGSSKSLLMAHIGMTHVLENPGARLLIGRRTLPDLKETIFQMILDHIGDDLIEDVDYHVNNQRAFIKLKNGSEIIGKSWADRKYKKVRSLPLSAAIIEELTENSNKDKDFYFEIKNRIGRAHAKEHFILCATNPDSPSHWAYDYFIDSKSPERHVYYSKTADNPFLPDWYLKQLEQDLDPKMVRRMLYGEWLELATDVIYYQYDKSKHFVDKDYVVNPNFPIHWSWDFNIGMGKPFSVCFFQYIKDTFHFFDEIIIEGQRTEQICEEAHGRGLLDHPTQYIINGDQTGKHRDTRSFRDDYQIITQFLSNCKNKKNQRIHHRVSLPSKNPPVRKRHNLVNGYLLNGKGEVRIQVYKKCVTVDKGFRLTHLVEGGKYLEDDSDPFQHVLTAVGYGIYKTIQDSKPNLSGMM